MTTALQQLLGEMPKTDFVRDFLHRQPISRSGAAAELNPLGSWDRFAEVLRQPTADVLIVRQGERYAGDRPATQESMQQLIDQGYTLLIRHAERHQPQLQSVADDFAGDFQAPVNIHMYATPPGQWGFSWHYDAEEVFIVQTAGRKNYSLRKNTVNPWPLEETLPTDMHYEREIMPLLRVELAEGDWLYIPGGWWHQAESKSDDIALSLAIGVMPRTALDVFDFLRGKLLDSMLWRQRLPLGIDGTDEADLKRSYRELLATLGDDLQRELRREALPLELQDHFQPSSAVES